MFKHFMKSSSYLSGYHRNWIFALVPVNLALLAIAPPDLSTLVFFLPCLLLMTSVKIESVIAGVACGIVAGVLSANFAGEQVALIPVGVTLALSFSGLIHCASHGSLRPRFLNRPVGELLGLLQLSGFADWKIVHILHHSHTDNPVKDPHPPQNLSYWDYTKNMRSLIVKAFVAKVFSQFGQTPEVMKNLKAFSRNSKIAHVNKVLFWFLILKPQVFVFLFAPSILAKMFQFSWLNWAAHRPGKAGVEIRNMDQGIVYAYMNFFSFGLYVHKNHHLVPTLFNPKTLTPSAEKIAS